MIHNQCNIRLLNQRNVCSGARFADPAKRSFVFDYACPQRLASKLSTGLAASLVDPLQYQLSPFMLRYDFAEEHNAMAGDGWNPAKSLSLTGYCYHNKTDSLYEMPTSTAGKLERGWQYSGIGPENVTLESELAVIQNLYSSSAIKPEPVRFFYHGDHLGSSSWITGAFGNVNQYLAYTSTRLSTGLPFGEQFIDQRDADGHDIRFKFTGKEKDSETGYSFPMEKSIGIGARYYDAELSLWLSVDPLADKYPSMSPFMYTAGNPVMLVDHKGLAPVRTKVGKFLNKLWNWSRGHGWEEGSYSGTFYGHHRKLDVDAVKNLPSGSQVSKKEYIRYWEKTHGKKMKKSRRKLISDGCIGLVEAENNKDGHPLNVSPATSFDNLQSALDYANEQRGKGKTVILFSLEFHTDKKDKYKGDPVTHIVRVTSPAIYVHEGLADYNYTLYDFNTGTWWGANNGDDIPGRPPMVIYKYSQSQVGQGIYNDYEGLVFSVIVK